MSVPSTKLSTIHRCQYNCCSKLGDLQGSSTTGSATAYWQTENFRSKPREKDSWS